MKGNYKYANFFVPIFKETWKTLVELCGALYIFNSKNWFKKRQKRKKPIYICQLFLANFHSNLKNVSGAMRRSFQENPENGCGAMWRYFSNIVEKRQKMSNMKETNTYGQFFDQFSRKSGKRLWRYVALFFEPWKNVKKMPNMKETNTYGQFFRYVALFFRTLEKRQKMPNMKETNTYGQFFHQFSRKSGKRLWRYVALFFERWKNVKKCQTWRNQYIWPVFFINFQENPENGCGAMWRYFSNRGKTWKNAKHEGNEYIYGQFFSSIFKKIRTTAVALCGAILERWKNVKKCQTWRKRIHTSIFKKIRKTAVALCGAIFRTLEKRQKMPNMKETNTYGQFFLINFQENPEKRLWRYVALFFERWKNVKKCQTWRKPIHMANFFHQFSRKSGKRLWRCVALCGAIFRTLEKRQKNSKHEGNQYIWPVSF